MIEVIFQLPILNRFQIFFNHCFVLANGESTVWTNLIKKKEPLFGWRLCNSAR